VPECALGIVPDVGATDYLRSCLEGGIGQWASLTGGRFSSDAMAAGGLCTHVCGADETERQPGQRSLPSTSDAAEAVQATYSSLVDCSSAAELRDTIGEGRLPQRPRERPTVRESTREEYAGLCDEITRRLRRTIDSCGAAATAPMAAATRAAAGGYEAAAASLVFARETLDSASALQRLPARLCDAAEAAEAKGDLGLASWARDTRAALSRASPAALLVALECLQLPLPEEPLARRAAALGAELAANQALGCRDEFAEGVACAVGERKGQPPRWEHASVEEAEGDPAVQRLLDAVRRAPPLDLELESADERRSAAGRSLEQIDRAKGKLL